MYILSANRFTELTQRLQCTFTPVRARGVKSRMCPPYPHIGGSRGGVAGVATPPLVRPKKKKKKKKKKKEKREKEREGEKANTNNRLLVYNISVN